MPLPFIGALMSALGSGAAAAGSAAAGAAGTAAATGGKMALGALAKKGLMSAGKFGLNFLGNRLMNGGGQPQQPVEMGYLPPTVGGGQMMASPSVQHAMRPQVQRGFY